MIRWLLAAAVFAATMTPTATAAQGGSGMRITTADANDSLAVLRDLEASLKSDPRNAATWHRIGMLAWGLTEWAKESRTRTIDPTRMGRQADTSLRVAASLAPDKPLYRIAVGRYLLASGIAMTRSAAFQQFEQAVRDARKAGDPYALAEAAVELGYAYWRRYDGLVNRRIETSPGAGIRTIALALQPLSGTGDGEDGAPPNPQLTLKAVRERIETSTQGLPTSVTGDSDYDEADRLFREALEAAPQHPRALRAVAMAMAERQRWSELRVTAQTQLQRIPWDPYGWMVLGLAAYRSADVKAAAAAFDSAFTYLAPSEAQRLDRLERVMRNTDSSTLANASPAQRDATGRLYWLFADPLWSREGNETRLEFLARVTFAELRWTVWDLGVRGADTDRGDIYIRYGPPSLIAAFGSTSAYVADVSTVWVYDSGLLFSFLGTTAFGTARTGNDDKLMVERMTAAMPVRWDNLASIRVDTMATTPTRFRAEGDSVDLVVAARPPVSTIRESAPTQAGLVRSDWWVLAGGTQVVARDSLLDSPEAARLWSARVAPGTYVYRLEASVDEGTIAAKAAAPIVVGPAATDGFATSGFGVSDLLLATSVEPRGAAQRWRDFEVTPAVGAFARDASLGLVWEMYELGQRDGSAQYTFSLTIKRERGTVGRITARVLGSVAGAAGVDTREDQVTITFDRTMPHAATLVDHMQVALGDTPPGTYAVTLQITDRVTNRTAATRTRSVVIR
jgi:GWxTD domain-containing protein